jgi:hypothetical protein
MDGDAALTAMVAMLRKLGALPGTAARLAAPRIEVEVKKTAAAGTTPEGKSWAPKKSGGQALMNAAAALSARAVGTAVVVSLKGVEVLHNFGSPRLPARQILPEGGAGIPPNIVRALHEAAADAFRMATKGRP